MILQPEWYAITLAEFYMLDEWITEILKCCFTFMPHPYTFVCNADTGPKQYIMEFAKNIVQYGVLARFSGSHPDRFLQNFGACFTDIDCLSMNGNAGPSNVLWLIRKLARPNTRKILDDEFSIHP